MLKAVNYWPSLEKKVQMCAELNVFVSSFYDMLICGFSSCWVISAMIVVLRSISSITAGLCLLVLEERSTPQASYRLLDVNWSFLLQSENLKKPTWPYSGKSTLHISILHTHNILISELEKVVELSLSSHRYIKPLQCANTQNIVKLDALEPGEMFGESNITDTIFFLRLFGL